VKYLDTKAESLDSVFFLFGGVINTVLPYIDYPFIQA